MTRLQSKGVASIMSDSDPGAETATTAAGALAGIRVLDLTQVLAGPYCTQILGDFGAEVIKIESPRGGDQSRASMGPRLKGDDRAGFLAVNRNKKSVTLNLKEDEGREVFLRLVESADVLVENYRPGTTAKLKIDYPSLKALNPRLIYASVSGFGQSGPYASRPGYDLIAQAMSGVMSVTGETDGRPVKCGLPISDLTAGIFAALGILTAHAARARTGCGQHVETSLFEAALGLSIWEAVTLWTSGHAPGPLGSAHRLTAPYQALKTKDGYVTIAANNPRSWTQLCKTLGNPALAADPRFDTNDQRMTNVSALITELEGALSTKTTDEWMQLFLADGIASGPIRTYDEVFADPHTQAREMVVTMNHPVEGALRALATPIKLDGTPATIRRAAPLLGEHTEEILRSTGYTTSEIENFRRRGII